MTSQQHTYIFYFLENTLIVSWTSTFLLTLYQMVDDESTNDIIRWNDPTEENGFKITDTSKLVSLLDTYYKKPNYNSFVRQLNLYCFYKKGKQSGISTNFFNQHFVRGDVGSLRNIQRKMQVKKLIKKPKLATKTRSNEFTTGERTYEKPVDFTTSTCYDSKGWSTPEILVESK